eukprot:10457546-Alexandrium_andersonii.AAC.1
MRKCEPCCKIQACGQGQSHKRSRHTAMHTWVAQIRPPKDLCVNARAGWRTAACNSARIGAPSATCSFLQWW